MDQVQKISESELSELKLIKEKYNKLIYNFGTLAVEKISLDKALSDYIDKEKKLKDEWLSIQKMEDTLLNNILNKYGEIEVNMETGIINKKQ